MKKKVFYYIIYGVGQKLEKNIVDLDLTQVVAFSDKKFESFPDGYAGKMVISPDEISNYKDVLITISSNKFYEEILNELVFEHSVPINRIIPFDFFLDCYYQSNINPTIAKLKDFTARYNRQLYGAVFQNAFRYSALITQYMKNNGMQFLYDNKKYEFSEWNDVLYVNRELVKCNTNKKVSIYVVSHKDYHELGDNIYHTVWVGNRNSVAASTYDIDYLNPLINECTGLYWVWKHDSVSDFIGLNHYRRFFESPLNPGLPVQKWEIAVILSECDVIVSEAFVFEGCEKIELGRLICEEAYSAGLNALCDLFNDKTEEERRALECFLNGNFFFPCQMFIMRRELLDEYCSWLFPILFDLIERVEIKEEWDPYSKRIIGFIAERLFTVWLMLTEYRIEELPVIKTDDLGPYGLS